MKEKYKLQSIDREIKEGKKLKIEFMVAEDLWRNFSAICEQLRAIPEEVIPLLIREEIYMQANRIQREKMSEEEKARERLRAHQGNILAAFKDIFEFMETKVGEKKE